MIAWLNGILIHKTPQMIILDVNNVGYQLLTPSTTYYSLPEIKQSVSLYVYTHVREDALLLFGFLTEGERELFTLLLGVSGIGPKLAITILSGLSPKELIHAVQKEDLARLSSIPGIGKKTAGRMVLELKEKVGGLSIEGQNSKVEDFQHPASSPKLEEILSALVNLGYNRQAIKSKVEAVCQANLQRPLEELIRESLKLLVKG
ncbi:MAG: Holliday junction branch migration protein RuvA [Nitrospirae bacterium]|nr:Holliday junction branch migration protein RuvA [Nitrospirota bacterium]